MPQNPRVALLHTGAVVIPPVTAAVRREMPEIEVVNYLDDRIVADLRDPARVDSVPERVRSLVHAASVGGAQVVMLTCSSISPLAARLSQQEGIPVLRIDEAMADAAVARATRIAVVATLSTTCEPTEALIRERAELAEREPEVHSVVVEDAFEAATRGERDEHDRRVRVAVTEAADWADVVVLAQASMAGVLPETAAVPMLTSVERGVRQLREFVTSRQWVAPRQG